MIERRRLNPHRRRRETSLWPTGAALRAARVSAGLTVRELAERLGWSRSSVSEYEGSERVRPELASAMYAALGVDVAPSALSLELVAGGDCATGCVDGHDEARYWGEGATHAWSDFRVSVAGFSFPTLYRVHADSRVPGDAYWHEVPYGGPIERWIRGDLHARSELLTEAAVRAADPWPGSGFDPTAYRTTPPWKFWSSREGTRR